MRTFFAIVVALVVILTPQSQAKKLISGSGATAKSLDIRDHEAKIITVRCSPEPRMQLKFKRCDKKMPEKARELEVEARSFIAPTMDDIQYKAVLCDPDSLVHEQILDYKVRHWNEMKDNSQTFSKKEKKKLKKFYKCVAKIATK